MTIQQAARKILEEHGSPLDSRSIARRALEMGFAQSSARDPVQSLAQTLEKNIRDGTYNRPELKFVHQAGRRLIALPEWSDAAGDVMPTANVNVDEEYRDDVRKARGLYVQRLREAEKLLPGSDAQGFDDRVVQGDGVIPEVRTYLDLAYEEVHALLRVAGYRLAMRQLLRGERPWLGRR